jgi:pyrroline-5-carboxylate reductase
MTARTAASSLLARFSPERPLAFIGGGNMASAILGGLVQRGLAPQAVRVVEPFEEARQRLQTSFGVQAQAAAGPALAGAALVVWAVKPQTFKEAAGQAAPHFNHGSAADAALHLSVAAGIRSDSIARWLGSERVVRSMPNTPALVGQGMTALFAREAVTAADRALVDAVIAPTGDYLWVEQERQLDAVTALSGSGPAYVFLFLEAMIEAGTQMGLEAEQAKRLAIATFSGAAALAREASEPPSVLRERVTSKGGTTYAALTAMQAARVPQAFIEAMHAAGRRATELGDEFGKA